MTRAFLGGDRHIQRELFWVTFGQALSILGSLIGVRLLTDALSPDAYGELTLGITASTLGGQLVFGPLSSGLLRFFSPAREAGQLTSFLRGMRVLLVRAAFLTSGLFGVLGLLLLGFGHEQWLFLLALSLIFSVFGGFNSVLDCLQNAARMRATVALHQGAGQWVRFTTAVILIRIFSGGSAAGMLGFAAGALIVLLSQTYFFRRASRSWAGDSYSENKGIESEWRNKVFHYSWPFAAWGLFTWVQLSSDRWALQAFTGPQEVGFFSVLYQLGFSPMVILSGLIAQLVAPILFGRAGDGINRQRTREAYKMNVGITWAAFILTFFGAGLGLLFHRQIFLLLVAPVFRSVSPLLPLMLLSGGLFATAQMAVQFLTLGVNTKILIAPKIVSAILGILLNLVGAYFFGLEGVVYSCLGFSIIYLVWILLLVRTLGRTLRQ